MSPGPIRFGHQATVSSTDGPGSRLLPPPAILKCGGHILLNAYMRAVHVHVNHRCISPNVAMVLRQRPAHDMIWVRHAWHSGDRFTRVWSRSKTNPPKPGSIRIRRGSVRIFEDPWIRGSKKKKKKSPAQLAYDVPRPRQLRAWTLRDRLRPSATCAHAVHIHSHCSMFSRADARLIQAYRCVDLRRGKLVVAESSERTADSRKPRRCF